jgi:hypothetical protein
MFRLSPFGCLACLAAALAACKPEASAPPGEGSSDRVVRKELVFAGRKFVRRLGTKSFRSIREWSAHRAA